MISAIERHASRAIAEFRSASSFSTRDTIATAATTVGQQATSAFMKAVSSLNSMIAMSEQPRPESMASSILATVDGVHTPFPPDSRPQDAFDLLTVAVGYIEENRHSEALAVLRKLEKSGTSDPMVPMYVEMCERQLNGT